MFAQIHAEIETIEVRKAFTWNHNPNLQKEIIAEINETYHFHRNRSQGPEEAYSQIEGSFY